jgi:hypothetical protein
MSELIRQLKSLEDFIDKHEKSFLKQFVTHDDILMGLNGIWFGAENIKYYYILYSSGQHTTDNISWEEFREWENSIK